MNSIVEVVFDREERITRARDPDDKWDNDCTEADISVHGIKVVDEENYRHMAVPFKVVSGQTYYLLWADYNTGDSFGSYGNQVEFVDLFQTYEAAEIAKQELLSSKKYSTKYTRDDGTRIDFYIPWEGYFESLNELNIESVGVVL